jgi:predicted metal-dependent hydrolase
VPYTLHRSARRTLALTVHADGSVEVTAPHQADDDAIEARIRKRGAWLLKRRGEFDRLRPRTPERSYVPGETHRVLGRQYRLVVDPIGARGVSLTRDRIVVGGLEADQADRVQNRLARWYQREARRIFSQRYQACLDAIGLTSCFPRLSVRRLQKRWGSLSASGSTLVLNSRLVEADVSCIDFVIVHEMCHLAHHNHGPEFHALLAARMPDWRERKAVLERWML